MAGILPRESRTLLRHHRPQTSEELLDVGPYPSADGVAELQIIRPYAMGRSREIMSQHKTTPGGIDRVRRTPHLAYSFLRHTGLSDS